MSVIGDNTEGSHGYYCVCVCARVMLDDKNAVVILCGVLFLLCVPNRLFFHSTDLSKLDARRWEDLLWLTKVNTLVDGAVKVGALFLLCFVALLQVISITSEPHAPRAYYVRPPPPLDDESEEEAQEQEEEEEEAAATEPLPTEDKDNNNVRKRVVGAQ